MSDAAREFSIPAKRMLAGGLVAWRSAGGATGDGPPLILLHGFLGAAASWRGIVEGLAKRRRVVAIDLPGHGGTDLGRRPEDHDLAACSRVITAVRRHLGIDAYDLWGYSMGGRVALVHALEAGDGLGRLVLESATPGIEDAAQRAARLREDEERAAALERDGIEAFVDDWQRLPLFASQASVAADRLAHQRALRLATRAGGAALSLRAMGTGTMGDRAPELASLALPVLLLTGSLDARFTATAKRMQQLLPRARHRTIEGAGHNVHLEAPDAAVAAVGEFLVRTAAGDVQERAQPPQAGKDS